MLLSEVSVLVHQISTRWYSIRLISLFTHVVQRVRADDKTRQSFLPLSAFVDDERPRADPKLGHRQERETRSCRSGSSSPLVDVWNELDLI